jgi:hypothetical protein
MITLIPIEPLDEAHGMLIVAAFSRHFIINGGKQDGWGNGGGFRDSSGNGYGNGYGDGGDGYGDGYGNGNGWGDGNGNGGSLPEEWRVE